MTRRLTIVPIALLTLLAAAPGAGAWDAPAGCAGGSPLAAARTLIHPSAEIAEIGEVADFASALVLEPLVYPGVRHRLVRAGSYWCDSTGFNAAWRISGRTGGAVRVASAYASLAAAPYFDGITVRDARETAPGIVSLETHALTNGITARWLVHVDAEGVSRAAWTATDLAVEPFVAEIEGVTASPGVQRTYARASDGRVEALQAILPEPGPPETVTEGKTVDGFTIRLLYGETQYSPNLGQDTTVDVIDRPRLMLKMLLDNYQEFYDWGFRKGWKTDLGRVWIDSNTAMTCWACVYIREDFNIHLSSAVTQILFALGFRYPDDKQALSNVIGHEMTHDWQNAYYKPEQNAASSSVAFVEGVARMQESLHSYSGVSHQPHSLIYSVGHAAAGQEPLAATSCNGWDGADIEAAFAAGPFTSKTYNACYFWLTWYPRHGGSGYVDMFTAVRDHAKKAGHAEVIDSLVQAVGFET